MARYVDGFVLPLREENVEAYRKMSRKVQRVWMEHGALEYVECIGDDLAAEPMESFPSRFQTKPGETIAFAWIVYKSRAHRDKVNAKVMADPRLAKMMESGDQPFDCKRMVYGGFKVIVDTK